MEHVYVALFTTCEDGGYVVEFPDLPGCYSQGFDLHESITMAEAALGEWLEYLSDKGMDIPKASRPEDIKHGADQFATLVHAEVAVSTEVA